MVDLQHFITETITQIVIGVQNAGKNLKDSGAIVSPRGIVPCSQSSDRNYGYLNEKNPTEYRRIVEEIEFDVAVTANSGTETKGGAGIVVGIIGLGTQGKSEAEKGSISRIKFSVPIVLPNP